MNSSKNRGKKEKPRGRKGSKGWDFRTSCMMNDSPFSLHVDRLSEASFCILTSQLLMPVDLLH